MLKIVWIIWNLLTRCLTYSAIAFKAESVNLTRTTLFELECDPGFREVPPSPRRPSVSEPSKLLLPNSFIFDIEEVLFNVVESNPNFWPPLSIAAISTSQELWKDKRLETFSQKSVGDFWYFKVYGSVKHL